MTPKERLVEAIEHTPESIIIKLLEFLDFLKTRHQQTYLLSQSTLSQPADVLPQDLSFRALSGILHKPGRSAVSLEAMDEAIVRGILGSA
jgi:hypothetical protein